MKLVLKEDPREWRKFTLLALLGPAILGLILYARKVLPGHWLAVWEPVLGVIAVLALLRPRGFRGFYRFGRRFGFALGQCLERILLFIVFFAIVSPLGWLLRRLGKDPLQLKRDDGVATHWQPSRGGGSLDKMF